MKDPFKQNLVNELDSEMVEKEKTLFKRLHEIFPEFEIKTIYNDFYNSKKTTISTLKFSQFSLSEQIRVYFNLEISEFLEKLASESNFRQLLNQKNSYYSENIVINDKEIIEIALRPLSDQDYEICRINGNIEFKVEKETNLPFQAIKRYLMKRMLCLVRATKRVLINLDEFTLDSIELNFQGKTIEDDRISIQETSNSLPPYTIVYHFNEDQGEN